ncbi:MAG TPA: mechanosensitive ion channel domain-containing protein [Bryobacteraceae bacterium]|nr:mechanosensitive ion channel domain-containing protein [Bryobacteraceae bacterium]
MIQLIPAWETWVRALVLVTGAVLLGLIAHLILYWFLRRLAVRAAAGQRVLEKSFVGHTYGPVRLLLPIAAAHLVSDALRIPAGILEAVRHLLSLAMIGALCWLTLRLIKVFDDLVAQRYLVSVPDNYRARSIRTQILLMQRILTGATLLAAVAAMLMTFPSVWNLGAGLFASVGVAGLVIGMAARPALSNMLAGVQVALTEPIRIDDVVIVEGEYGRVEEVNTTYVILRIWDKRRLVVPLTYFIEKPFQNWTRMSSDLLGTVVLYTDYMAPVEEIRRELERVVRASSLWDGKAWNLQVTDTKDRMLELRCMVSAVDSATLWDLRVEVREKMIGFLQKHHPWSLPVMRTEIAGDGLRELTVARDVQRR